VFCSRLKIDFVLQQPSHLLESVGNQVRWKSVGVVAIAEIHCESLQVVHVFCKIFGDVRLQNLENASLATSALRVAPPEANNRAHTRLGEYGRCDFDRKRFQPRSQVLRNDGLDFCRPHIADSVFQPPQRSAQSGPQVLIPRNHLPELLQAGDFRDQPKQTRLGGRVLGQFELFQEFGSEARRRQSGQHKHHCVSHWWTPFYVRLRNQPADGHNSVDDPRCHGLA